MTARDNDQDIDTLDLRRWAAKLRGRIILPGDRDYDISRQVWNRAVDRRPAVIVRCAHVDDIARSIELSRGRGLPLAIRSGGHSQAGYSVCEGGVVIDLSGLNEVVVNAQGRIARAAAGARVSDLLDATRAHGLTTPMGGCPDVGIGGLTLGGGENLLMAKYGAVCDNVVSAQVVTVSGDVVTASDAENPDLFWALRGGGGNFGVVASFDYRLHADERVLSGVMHFPRSRTRDVVRRYRDLMADAPDELQTSGGLEPQPDGSVLSVALCCCGDLTAGAAVVERWRRALKPEKDTIAPGLYAADFTVPPAPSAGTGGFLPALTDAAIDMLTERFADAPPGCSALWSGFHGAVTRVPVDEMAFPLRQRGFDLFVSAPWHTSDERARASEWVARFRESLRPFSRGVYVNNLDQGDDERVREAYGSNYARLVAIKARYDPANVLRLNANIPPVESR